MIQSKHLLQSLRVLLLVVFMLHATTLSAMAGFASTSVGSSLASKTNRKSIQDAYGGIQQGVSKKMHDQNRTQTDQSAPTYPTQYGNSEQGDTVGSSGKNVTTQKPEPQSQKQAPANQAQGQGPLATDLSYSKVGGQNIAVPGNVGGSSWYHSPADTTNISAKGQLAHSGYAATAYQGFPKWPQQGLVTSSQKQMNRLIGAITQAQMANSPENQQAAASANSQAQQQGASDAAADSAENAMDTNMILFRQTLINVANEDAGTPTTAYAPIKLLSQAVWMVQQMYKGVYVPMALLLLLPGALLTNLKGLVSVGILGNNNDEDGVSPFSGILRALIALFLIPSTQLIVSWATDIGNSLTYEVQKNLVPAEILMWAKQQTFNAPQKNAANALELAKGAIAGKIDEVAEEASQVDQQSSATRMMQMAFNFMNMALGLGMAILLAFQVVMMCYLFLMGPIAAAFFAWPASCGQLFKNIFVNWVDAVTNLALWRFWWCIVILCMQTRIEWLMELGEFFPNSQWEMAIFTAFMVILTYVPFLPFDYKPGEMVAKILEKASEAQQGGGGGGGGGGCGGGGGGEPGGGGETSPGGEPGGTPSSAPSSAPQDPQPSSGMRPGDRDSDGNYWTMNNGGGHGTEGTQRQVASNDFHSAPPTSSNSPAIDGHEMTQTAMAPPPMHDQPNEQINAPLDNQPVPV